MPTPNSAALSDLAAAHPRRPGTSWRSATSTLTATPSARSSGWGTCCDALPELAGRPGRVTLACQDPAPEIAAFPAGRETGGRPHRQPAAAGFASRPRHLAGRQRPGAARQDLRRPGVRARARCWSSTTTSPICTSATSTTSRRKCASTSQLVVALADALGVPLPASAAVPLLVGLVTDTLGLPDQQRDGRRDGLRGAADGGGREPGRHRAADAGDPAAQVHAAVGRWRFRALGSTAGCCGLRSRVRCVSRRVLTATTTAGW